MYLFSGPHAGPVPREDGLLPRPGEAPRRAAAVAAEAAAEVAGAAGGTPRRPARPRPAEEESVRH